jgi:hypothetical protein
MEHKENRAWICGVISGICFMGILWIVIDAMSK